MVFIYVYKNEPSLLRRATHCHPHVKSVTQLSPCTTGRTRSVNGETCSDPTPRQQIARVPRNSPPPCWEVTASICRLASMTLDT